MAGLKFMVSLLAVAKVTAAALTRANPVVSVKNGSYEGLYLPAFNQDIFLGIPYARDTGGANRFRVPQSLDETWNGTRAAKAYGPGCPDYYLSAEVLHGMSEDCLSINIVRPAGIYQNGGETPLLPVMFWIHGGAYQYGGSAQTQYNLTYLVQKSVDIGLPIIGVSINYRKGGWGNMYSIEIQGSGNTNLALRDMRKALAWVQENIENFGGNSSSVTIWGQSAGSFAVGQLVMSYGGRTDGLFHRSIQESGSATTAWCNGSDWYQPIYNKIVDQVNCSSVPDTLECLRTIDYDTLYPFLNSSTTPGPGYYPTVDGDILPNYPSELLRAGRFAHIPHLYWTVSDEGTDNAPLGIDTDEELRTFLLQGVGFDFPAATVDHIMELYPDDPAQGVPVNTGEERFADRGWQYKRVAAIVGDIFYHGPRRFDAKNYIKYSPTYTYRFNTRPWESTSSNTTGADNSTTVSGGELAPAYKGVEHFSEVAFVFANPTTVGPWPEYRKLSDQLSSQWIRFAYTGDPNGPGLPQWPQYNKAENGVNLVLQTEAQGGSYVEDDIYRLAGREYLTQWSRRRHV